MKKMRLVFIILVWMMFISSTSKALEVETSITINGAYLKSDTNHLLLEDTVFVVGRTLVEAFGGKIGWREEIQTVVIQLEGKYIEMIIGENEALVNGEIYRLNKAPFIKDGRTMIPLRFVSEVFDCQVNWNGQTYTVVIEKEGLVVDEDFVVEPAYTEQDLYLLAKIVTVESGDGSLEMKMAIANTVLNRVKDPRFPNTIAEVIYQDDVCVQFPPAHRASFATLEPSQMAIVAAKKTLEGVNNIGESLYFNNAPFKSKSADLICVIEGEYFYR